ncbi:hypothetical protein T4E_7457 [Trichinella pseudospiralis]|uniref:Uncharacterized protein n=1 Tax=Trichinella pseudospiralis TaxID=6337 RepID=A0A0V0Y1G7_TRIPS|nr:hypothetical protein T4E_7457 [Trichinella pseudospiralis]
MLRLPYKLSFRSIMLDGLTVIWLNMASGKLCKRVHRDLSQQPTLGKHVMTMKGDCSAQRLIRLHKQGHHYL